MKPLLLSADGSARKLEVEEDEEDLRERERLRAEMAQLGIEERQLGNQAWNKTSTTNSSAPDSPSPPPPPKDVETEAVERILETKQREEDAKAELNQGRASGFTEAPQRRKPGSMRSHSQSSSIGGFGAVGLGIDGRVTPPQGSPSIGGGGSGSVPPSPRVDGAGAEEQPVWGKALRRLSRGWSSPPMS